MRIVGGGEHVEAVTRGVGLAPEEVALHFAAVGDGEDTGIEGGVAGVGVGTVEGGGEEAGGDGGDFLDGAFEPHAGIVTAKVGHEEGVFVALAVGEGEAGHLAGDEEGGGVEGVGEGLGIGAFEVASEGVEALAIDTDDDPGFARQQDTGGVFVVAFNSVPEFVVHCQTHFPMRVVLDTNILISAVWKPGGNESRVVAMAVGGKLEIAVCDGLEAEYRDVAGRKKFAKHREGLEEAIAGLLARAVRVEAVAECAACSDPDDNLLLDCAVAAGARYVVTGNGKHFPEEWRGVAVINARRLLEL